MYKNNKYRRGKIIYKGSLIILAIGLVLAAYKVNHIINKVSLVKEAIALHEKQDWIETENTLQKAQSYKGFHYKEVIIGNYLKELNWVTEFNPFIKNLEEELKVDYSSSQYELFIALCERYEQSGFKSLDAKKKEYLLARYPVEQEIATGYINFKALMERALSDPVNNLDYIWAKKAIWDIPQPYFVEGKEATVKALFIRCDIKLFEEAISKEGNALSLQNIMENMNSIYITNKKYSYQSEWLTERLKPYLEKLIKEKSSAQDIQEFISYAKVYEQNIISSYQSEKIEGMIAAYIKKMEAKAQQLADKQNYIDAIAIYTALGEYKDYSKQIDGVNQVEKYDHKELLLSQEITQYSLIKEGRDLFGAENYVLGLNPSTNTLELVLVDGKRSEYRSKTYYMPSTQKEVQDISIINNLIMLRSPSSQRDYTYALIAFSEGTFNKRLSIEANAIEVIKAGESLIINSPLDGFEGYNYEYIYTGDSYKENGILSSVVSLNDFDFMSYEGKVITFDCYIPLKSEGTNALGMYYDKDIYYPKTAVSLYLENGSYMKSGTYTVTGMYVENTAYYNEEHNTEELRPRINIVDINEKLGG